MKLKILIFVTILISGINLCFSQKYFTKTGKAYFMSHTDEIDIDGTSKNVVSFLDIKTGEIVFGINIKSFEFTLATAVEHFNETYMESHLFPKSSFKGVVKDFQKIDFSKSGKYDVVVEGDLTIHGVTKKVSEKGTLVIKDKEIIASSSFKVAIADYNIKVPKIVVNRVAQIINVKIDAEYKPYTGN